MFNTSDHFICENEQYNVEFINGIKDIDFGLPRTEYEELKKKSRKFLKNSLFEQ